MITLKIKESTIIAVQTKGVLQTKKIIESETKINKQIDNKISNNERKLNQVGGMKN